MCNLLISRDIRSYPSDWSVDEKGLSMGISSDNVLHGNGAVHPPCITSSEVRHDIHRPTRRTHCFPFCQTPVLDDQVAGCRVAVLHSLRPTLSGRGRILQQFHSQWWLVHPSLYPSIPTRRAVVLQRYRFFPCRRFDEYPYRAHRSQPSRYERGDAWGKASLPVPCGSGESMAKE